MPNPDNRPDPSVPARQRGQPSLMGGAGGAPSTGANGDGSQVRMLAEFESAARPMIGGGERPASSRVIVLLLAVIALVAGVWWWNQSRAPATDTVRMVQAPAVPAGTDARPAEVATATPAASAPAAIETLPQASAPLAVLAADGAASSAAAGQTVAAVAAPQPVQRARTADKRVVKHAPNVQRANAVAARDTPRVADADVLLLSAMLAHVSRNGQGVALADQEQLTIAQLVKRCDLHAADESRECRRRICDGYWGKAEACPASLAPRKN